MSDLMENIHERKDGKPSRGTLRSVVRWILFSIGIIIVFIILLAGLATWWLTPERFTGLINREANKNLSADVRVWNARYSLWTTFPRFCIEIDSIRVVSHSLDKLNPDIMAQLPPDARFLTSTSKIKGGINIMRLLTGKLYLKDVEIDSIDVNLVSASDLITNYDIFKSSVLKGELPYFTADNVTLRNPKRIRFFSNVKKAGIDIDLNEMSLKRIDDSDIYNFSLSGLLNARTKGIALLRDFPFALNGNVGLGFNPFSITTSDYSVAFGNAKGKLKMDIRVGEDPVINDLGFKITGFDVIKFLEYMPNGYGTVLKSIDTDIILDASASLATPFKLSDRGFPSVEADIKLADSDIDCQFTREGSCPVRHIGVKGKMFFNGKDVRESYFYIPDFSLAGKGIDVSVSARIKDIVFAPVVEFQLKGKVNATEIGKTIKGVSTYGLRGNLGTDISGSLDLSGVRKGNIGSLDIKGDISLTDYGMCCPSKDIIASGKTLEVDFKGKVGSVSTGSFSGTDLEVGLSADKIDIENKKIKADVRRLLVKSRVGDSTNACSLNNIPINIDLTAKGMHYKNSGNAMDVVANGVTAKAKIKVIPSKSRLLNADLNFKGESVKGKLDGSSLDLAGVYTKISLRRLPVAYKQPVSATPVLWCADDPALGKFPHSSKYLTANLSDSVKKKLLEWDGQASVKIAGGMLRTPSFPVINSFDNLYVEASLDSVLLHRLHLRSQSTGLDLSAKIGNMRSFLCDKDVSPIYLSLNVALDTVQINQLAAAYEKGVLLTKGVNESGVTPTVKASDESQSAFDTTAMLIPRNLVADVHANARMTRYMNLQLEDLSTDISVRDGNADVKDLRISSDFGDLGLALGINTGNVEKMGVDIKGGIHDINVVNFFKNFHTLLLMMPQMKNLSGEVSADIDARMSYFPNMYIDVPSVSADMFVQGRGLTVHQDHFIRRVTRMLMIHNSGDIHIRDMNVHAQVRDNLLMLYPFNFEFDRYNLQMQGVNNFNGNLYYHIGVRKSPVPIPFGVNIKGKFSSPQIRFGGEEYKVDQGAEITRSIMENHKINIVRIARKYLKMFVRKAAESDNTPESEYIFNNRSGVK